MQLKTILVVDNDDQFLQKLAPILAAAGYCVLTSNDGADALAQMRASLPSLVLLDMVMPAGMDGWSLLKEKSHDPSIQTIPVILEVASDEWARMLGAVAVVRKPIDLQKLIDLVQAHCP